MLQQFTTLVERASIDEAYLDITDIVVKRLKEMNDGKYILLPNKLAGTYAGIITSNYIQIIQYLLIFIHIFSSGLQ